MKVVILIQQSGRNLQDPEMKSASSDLDWSLANLEFNIFDLDSNIWNLEPHVSYSNLVGHAYSWGINTHSALLLLENTRSWQVSAPRGLRRKRRSGRRNRRREGTTVDQGSKWRGSRLPLLGELTARLNCAKISSAPWRRFLTIQIIVPKHSFGISYFILTQILSNRSIPQGSNQNCTRLMKVKSKLTFKVYCLVSGKRLFCS